VQPLTGQVDLPSLATSMSSTRLGVHGGKFWLCPALTPLSPVRPVGPVTVWLQQSGCCLVGGQAPAQDAQVLRAPCLSLRWCKSGLRGSTGSY
jgi:hypothetical protein